MEVESATYTGSTARHHESGKAVPRGRSQLLDLVRQARVVTSSLNPKRDEVSLCQHREDIRKLMVSSAKRLLNQPQLAKTRPQQQLSDTPESLQMMATTETQPPILLPMDLLPPEIASEILNSLDLVSMLSCRSVCRLWRDLIDAFLGDTIAMVRKLHYPSVEDFMRCLAQVHSWYKHLPLEGEPFWFFLGKGYQPRYGYRRERYSTGGGDGIHWWYERGETFVQQRLYAYLLPLSVSLNCFVGRPNFGAVESTNGEGRVRDYVTALYPDLAAVIYNPEEAWGTKYEAQEQVFVREFAKMEDQVRAVCKIIEKFC